METARRQNTLRSVGLAQTWGAGCFHRSSTNCTDKGSKVLTGNMATYLLIIKPYMATEEDPELALASQDNNVTSCWAPATLSQSLLP